MRRVVVTLWMVVIAGCVDTDARPASQYVATELQSRTGHHFRPLSRDVSFSIPSGVTTADGLSEHELVAIALWNNTAYREALTELGITDADVIQAGLLTNPTFSILFPVGPKQLEFTLIAPLKALWLRPRRIAIAETEAERLAEQLVNHGLNLVRDVRVAYLRLVHAENRAALAREAVRLHEEIERLAAARLASGETSAVELSTARLDAQRAREESTRFAADLQRSRITLLGLLGRQWADTPCPITPAEPTVEADVDLELMLSDARAARPDVRAAELAIEAVCARAGLARLEYLTLDSTLDANAAGFQGFEIGPGLQFTIPIFHQNQAGVARTRAEIERALARLDLVHEQVDREVRDAHARYSYARDAATIWRDSLLPLAEQALRQTQLGFEHGDVSLLPVLDATRRLLDARARAADAELESHQAWVELERAVGHRLEKGRVAERITD